MRQLTIRLLKTLSFLCAASVLCGSISLPTKAQVKPVYDYGAIGLGQLLKRLNNTKSVMHIGAHPDDEDSGLLAFLARGENARTAYLSLTRGDGGQNIIGSEHYRSRTLRAKTSLYIHEILSLMLICLESFGINPIARKAHSHHQTPLKLAI